MGDLVRSIAKFVNPNISNDVHTTALLTVENGISTKQLSLQQLVAQLGEYLTSVDEIVRSRGTLLLSEVISRLALPLDRVSAHFLIRFYCDRLQDYPCVEEVLKGLYALIQYPLAEDEPELILRTTFQEVQCQSLPQTSRKIVLDITYTLINKHLTEIQAMKSDFIFGVIQVIDGEKDPRNLLVAFKLFVKAVKCVPEYTRFTEELFEIVSCYFPITFKPRLDDPDSITPEELTVALRNCFCATASFAPFCYTFLVDKLTSSLSTTKLETLTAISQCCSSFGASAVVPHVGQLWGGLRDELLGSKDPVVVDKALATVSDLTRVLSFELTESNGRTPLDELLDLLLIDCTNHISAFSDVNQVVRCSRILAVIAASSIRASETILSQSLPLAVKYIQGGTEQLRQPMIALLCALILSSNAAVSMQNAGQNSPHPLEPYSGLLYDHLCSALVGGDDTIRCSCVEGLGNLCAAAVAPQTLVLAPDTIDYIVIRITSLVTDDPSTKVQQQALKSLAILSRANPALVLSRSVPVLLEKVTDVPPLNFSIFTSLVALSDSDSTMFCGIIPKLLSIIEKEFQKAPKPQVSNPLIFAVLDCLSSAVVHNATNSSVMKYCSTNFFPQFISLLIQHSCESTAILDGHLLELSITMARIISQGIEPNFQDRLNIVLTEVFLKGNSKGLSLPQSRTFAPLSSGYPAQLQLMTLYATVVSQAKSLVVVDEIVLPSMLPLVTNSTVPFVASTSAKCVASILNKMPEGTLLENSINLVVKELSAANMQPPSIQALAWVVKGLLQRNHPKWQSISEKIVAFVGEPDTSFAAAQSFDIILADSQDVLNKQSAAIVRVLYKQKFFNAVFPLLLTRFKASSTSESSSPYLLAISNLVRHVPKSVLLDTLPEILPILVQSLSSHNYNLVLSTLGTILMLLLDTPESVSDSATSFIPPLLHLAVASSSAEVRQKSLNCIAQIASLPHNKIFLHKPRVLEILRQCLDDKKRVVRKEAVKTRNTWFVLSDTPK